MPEYHFAGELISDTGLEPVAQALADCSWRIELIRSRFDGTLYLRTPHTEPRIDIEMDSSQSGRFLFSGIAEGPIDQARSLLGELSAHLTRSDFTHRIELYDTEGVLAEYYNLHWLRTHSDPIA